MPGVWLAGRTVARSVVDDLWLSRLITPGFGFAGWLLAVHVSGLLAGSFELALWIGTLSVSAAGHLVHRLVPQPAPPVGWIPSKVMFAGVVVGTVAIAPMTLGWAFPDDLFITGHMSISSAIQNGPYPPVNLSFPALDLRYHYAFDLLNAGFTSIVRLPVDVGIDVLTLLCWAWMLALLWAASERVLGRNRGWVGPACLAFSGGVPLLCLPATDRFAEALVGACTAGDVPVNPPVVAYFLQHPWSIGIPLAITILFAFTGRGRPAIRYPALALLLVALALSQIVLFAAFSAALVVADAWDGKAIDLKRGVSMLACSAATVLIASRLGGFFASWPDGGGGLVLRAGVTNDPVTTVAWHLASFGVVLPIGIAGIACAPRGRIRTLLTCLAFGGLVIVNAVEYTLSWDIAKFGFLSMLVLAAGAAIVVTRLLDTGRTGIAVVTLGSMTMGGFMYLLALTLRLHGLPGYLTTPPVRLSDDDVAAVEWLRRNSDQRDVTYRASPMTFGYAQWGGLPQAQLDLMAPRLGFPPDHLADRLALLDSWPGDVRAARRQGIRWFVLDTANDEHAAAADIWIDQGMAVERAIFGDIRVVDLMGAGDGGPAAGR
jgi:hypothetical protein